MTVEGINAWFTPIHYYVYLGTLFAILVVFYQWKWARICKKNIRVLVVHPDGSSHFELCSKGSGSCIEIKDPKSNTTRLWAMSELATIVVPYPGVDFLPKFLQQQIRMTIVNELDWEPMINRNKSSGIIASPAVLGNLMNEKITEAVITVNKEMMDSLTGLVHRLDKTITPQMFYTGVGAVLIGLGFVVYLLLSMVDQGAGLTELAKDLAAIKGSLGLK